MDFMVAYYPILKLVAIASALYAAYLLLKNKHYKIAGAYITIMTILYIMSPLKIDGTNSTSYHVYQEQYQSSKYESQSEELNVPVQRKVLNLEERLAISDAKYDAKNKKIEEELNK